MEKATLKTNWLNLNLRDSTQNFQLILSDLPCFRSDFFPFLAFGKGRKNISHLRNKTSMNPYAVGKPFIQ